MIKKRARHLIFLSPSAKSPVHDVFVAEVESMGCKISAIAGEAQNMDHVRAALAAATGPVKGVFHLALKLQVSWKIMTIFRVENESKAC